MQELRLIDPDGYTVNLPGAVATVPANQAATAEAALRILAPVDAATWGHHLGGYRVQTTNIPV
jgi:hypothetical protein